MALTIKNRRTEELARRLSEETGESLIVAVTHALEERLARVENEPKRRVRDESIRQTIRELRALPDLDDRSPDEILGYDEMGLP